MTRFLLALMLLAFLFLALSGAFSLLAPSLSARVAPPGWEGEAIIATTAIEFGQMLTLSHLSSLSAVVLLAIVFAAALVTAVSKLGSRERVEIRYLPGSESEPVTCDSFSEYDSLFRRR